MQELLLELDRLTRGSAEPMQWDAPFQGPGSPRGAAAAAGATQARRFRPEDQACLAWELTTTRNEKGTKRAKCELQWFLSSHDGLSFLPGSSSLVARYFCRDCPKRTGAWGPDAAWVPWIANDYGDLPSVVI